MMHFSKIILLAFGTVAFSIPTAIIKPEISNGVADTKAVAVGNVLSVDHPNLPRDSTLNEVGIVVGPLATEKAEFLVDRGFFPSPGKLLLKFAFSLAKKEAEKRGRELAKKFAENAAKEKLKSKDTVKREENDPQALIDQAVSRNELDGEFKVIAKGQADRTGAAIVARRVNHLEKRKGVRFMKIRPKTPVFAKAAAAKKLAKKKKLAAEKKLADEEKLAEEKKLAEEEKSSKETQTDTPAEEVTIEKLSSKKEVSGAKEETGSALVEKRIIHNKRLHYVSTNSNKPARLNNFERRSPRRIKSNKFFDRLKSKAVGKAKKAAEKKKKADEAAKAAENGTADSRKKSEATDAAKEEQTADDSAT